MLKWNFIRKNMMNMMRKFILGMCLSILTSGAVYASESEMEQYVFEQCEDGIVQVSFEVKDQMKVVGGPQAYTVAISSVTEEKIAIDDAEANQDVGQKFSLVYIFGILGVMGIVALVLESKLSR